MTGADVRARVRRDYTLTPEEIAVKLRGEGVSLEDANRAAGLPDPDAQLRDEDAHVDAGDKLLKALGFEIVRLSQKRRSKITAGVPDRKAYHRRRRLTMWLEWKQPGGEQSPAQHAFQEMAEACGEVYLLVTYPDLCDWLVERGIIARRDLPSRSS